MAAVTLRPSPTIRNMASRRMPLANLPNAANSPYRDAVAPGTKRVRSHAGDQRELAYVQPPAKKMILEADEDETRRHALLRKAGQNPPTALQRKLEAVRDARTDTRPMSRAAERAQKASHENLESIRQWQRHYKKVFPQIVFYYESIPEDVRSKISRRVQTLGAVSDIVRLNIPLDTNMK
jgi:regulatory subunit for Cdc7p protein kinase